ncbi:MAG: sugar transferase [Bacteroidota bacterium]
MNGAKIFRMVIIDAIILILSFLLMVSYKPGTPNYLSWRYLTGLGILLITWIIASLYFKKYRFKKKYRFDRITRQILLSNMFSVSAIAIFVILFEASGYSRLVFFGTAGIATVFEIFVANLYYLLIHTTNNKTDIYNPPPKAYDLKKATMAVNYADISLSSDYVKEAIVSECGTGSFEFLKKHVNGEAGTMLCVSTTTRFNVEFQPANHFTKIINLKRVNDIQYINKFFETVNRKLPDGGLFMGRLETKDQRKKRILNKYPPVFNWIYYSLDFILKRIFPKFMLTKKIYFLLTRGNNRVLSKAEVLGRLYSCGFEELDEKDIEGHYYFVMKKKSSPAYDMNPTYGPFIKLNRVGKNGKLIKVYKMRTMHPYAEYLQDYIFIKNHLEEGGKFRNDFRITGVGKVMRKLWLDELPMIFNLLKGDMKIVGVRPISKHYYDLYSEELKQKRIKTKPGLIPPFYADLPKTLEEIEQSELRYLAAHEKSPFLTDIKYFHKAMYNIVFNKARSQ